MLYNTYHLKAARAIPMVVEYECEHCGHKNADREQFITLQAYSYGSIVNRVSDGMRHDAKVSFEKNSQKLAADVRDRRYKKLRLACTCKNCRKKQTWSSFFQPRVALQFAFVFGVVVLLSFLFNHSAFSSSQKVSVLTMSLLLLVPQSVITIGNMIKNQRIKKADQRFIPRITFVKQSPDAPDILPR